MMFPIRINVLSVNKKIHLKRLALFTYIKNACALIFSLIAVLAALLLIAQSYFINYQTALTFNKISQKNSFTIDTKHIARINNQIQTINEVQKQYVLWSPKVHEILSAFPEGVEVNSAIFDADTHTFSLVGVAKDRETLSQVEKAIKALPSLETVTIPEGELTRKEDIPFTVSATLK